MTRREAPEPWATAMRQKGITHRGVPSMTRLAEKADLGVQTVVNLVFGLTEPKVATVKAVAETLGEPKVWEWAGLQNTENAPWIPPDEANLLSKSERSALEALIRAVAERASGGHVQAPTKVEAAATAPRQARGRAGQGTRRTAKQK